MAESPEEAEVTGGASSTPQKETDVKTLSEEQQHYHGRPCTCICWDPKYRHRHGRPGSARLEPRPEEDRLYSCICRNCPGANGKQCAMQILNFEGWTMWAGLCKLCRTPEMEGELLQRSTMIENAANQCLRTGGSHRAPPGHHRGGFVEDMPDYDVTVWEDDEMELWGEWDVSRQYVRNGDLPPLM